MLLGAEATDYPTVKNKNQSVKTRMEIRFQPPKLIQEAAKAFNQDFEGFSPSSQTITIDAVGDGRHPTPSQQQEPGPMDTPGDDYTNNIQ